MSEARRLIVSSGPFLRLLLMLRKRASGMAAHERYGSRMPTAGGHELRTADWQLPNPRPRGVLGAFLTIMLTVGSRRPGGQDSRHDSMPQRHATLYRLMLVEDAVNSRSYCVVEDTESPCARSATFNQTCA